MDNKKLNLAIIARDPESSTFYKNLLSDYDEISLDEYRSISLFRSSIEEKNYSGVLIDVRTLIGSTMEEKEFFFVICEKMPVLNVNSTFDESGFSCFIEGAGQSNLRGKEALDYFVKQHIKKGFPSNNKSN